jgi:dimethylargininase
VTRIALTRAVSPAIGACELVHLPRRSTDVALARRQHRAYESALAALGCEVYTLPADPDLPDSVFVEDMAIVLDDVAVIALPGAPSRRPERDAVAAALTPWRPLLWLQPPATLDGGDVLRLDHTVIVGLGARTNAAAVDQLRATLGPRGLTVRGVAVQGCLHLKSAATLAGPRTVLCNQRWIDAAVFGDGMEVLDVDPAEPYAANGLLVAQRLIYPENFPATRARLERAGVRVYPVDVSELQKAEGAVTCCSLVFDA